MPRGQHPNSKASLKRGGGEATQDFRTNRMETVIAERNAEAEAIVDYARSGEMLRAQREVYGKLLAVANQSLDRAMHTRGTPNRIMVDISRELRSTAGEIRGLIEAESTTADAAAWFSDLDSHLQTVAERLEAGARPFEPSSSNSAS